MRKLEEQDEIMQKIQRKIDKDIERMKSKKDMDKSVEKQIRKQLLDLYLFQNAEESQKKTKLVDRLNKRAKDILEQNEQELLTNSKKKMNYIEKRLAELDFEFIRYNENIYGHRPVVYCYLNRKTELIDYIGSTGDMIKRLKSRNYEKGKGIPFDVYYRSHKAEYQLYLLRLCNTREEAYYYERRFIDVIKPKYNFQWNPDKLTKNKKKKQLVNANEYYDLNQWKQLSQEMRKNNDKCQICGAKSQDVHHIFPFMHQSPELREEVFFDKDNLLCLCEKCHYAIHHNKLLPVQKYWYEKLRNQISQKYLNQGKILSWL